MDVDHDPRKKMLTAPQTYYKVCWNHRKSIRRRAKKKWEVLRWIFMKIRIVKINWVFMCFSCFLATLKKCFVFSRYQENVRLRLFMKGVGFWSKSVKWGKKEILFFRIFFVKFRIVKKHLCFIGKTRTTSKVHKCKS